MRSVFCPGAKLTKTEDRVLLTVEDDGNGFSVKDLEQTKGMGIANIRHRVEYLSGIMDIISRPGEGSSFNIELSA